MFDLEKAKAYFAAKMAFTTDPPELDGMIKRNEPIVIVDVRLPSDYRQGHLPGAINLPKGKWHTGAGLSRDKLNVVYCYDQQCHLAAEAALEFARQGYPVMEMEGGYDTWVAKGLAKEAGSQPVPASAV
jgi:rhodanese-related sulfurtransferase